MAFQITWLAVHGKDKMDVLDSMHLRDTGILDEAAESPICAAPFPDGWTIIVLNRFAHPFAEDASLMLFSQDCRVIACHVEETAMFSAAQLYENGKRQWAVIHDSQAGEYHLDVEGRPPDELVEIIERQTQHQREDGEASGADYMFDIPLELAESHCGFRHDLMSYDWGDPRFTELEERMEMQ